MLILIPVACQKKQDEATPKEPPVKKAVAGMDAMGTPMGARTQLPKEKVAPVKMIGPKDELNCQSICDHLGYCQQKTRNHPPSLRRKTTCIARCKGEKSDTGKAMNKVIRACVDANRGDNCDKLMECMKTRLREVRKSFLSMKQPPRTGLK